MPAARDHAETVAPHAALAPYESTLLGIVDRRILSHRAARLALLALVAAILVIPSVQFVVKIQERTSEPWRAEKNVSALGRWLGNAEAFLAGENPYGVGQWFPGPPLVLLAIAPLTKLPVTAAAILWAGAKCAAVFGGFALMIAALRRPGACVPFGVVLMAALYSFRAVVADLQHGNLNIFVFVELAAVWYAYARGWDARAGLLLALAVVTKLTPALLLAYFAYKRAWRVVGWAVVGLLVFFLVLPSLLLGVQRNLDYLHAWFDMLVAPYALHGYVAWDIRNQSLPGVLTRWLAAAGAGIEHIHPQQSFEFGMEDMARPVSPGSALLIRAAGLAVLGTIAVVCRGTNADRRGLRGLLEFALVLVAMLLLSERTWKHHLTTMPIVFLAVWMAIACRPWSPRFRAAFVVGLGLQWLMLVASSEGVFGDDLADDLLDRGVVGVGLMLCFAQTAYLLWRLRNGSTDDSNDSAWSRAASSRPALQ